MFRALFVTFCVGAAIGLPVVGAAQRGPASGSAQAALRNDLDGMAARLGAGRGNQRDAIADAQRLAAGYRSLGPSVGSFGPADYALNRQLARQSLNWLGRAGRMYAHDPLAARTFLDAYDALGLFYRDHGAFYLPGAYVAWAGAARLAQRLTYYYTDPLWLQAADRYALAYGTLATANGMLVPPWTLPQDLPAVESTPSEAMPALTPVALPKIDARTLDVEQRGSWTDVRDRFQTTASAVHAARVLLDQLSNRLHQQGLALNPLHAATALKMQGALEDAAELIEAHEFDKSVESLRSAEAYRARLKSVTGISQ